MQELNAESLDGRQRLIRTAMRLFAEKGFDGVTVRDIAKASGVSTGLINHHFVSKEGLRNAVDEHFLEQFEFQQFVQQFSHWGSSEAYANWVDAWIARHKEEWPTLARYFRRALLQESEWGAALFSRFYEFNQALVTRADARGELRGDVDRLWLPFLMIFLEVGAILLDPYIVRVLGRSSAETEMWRRCHRAYTDLAWRGMSSSKTALNPD